MANKDYENGYYQAGYHFIAGCDEAGRGPLAGPLVVAACILPKDYENVEINDSKQISKKKRERLSEEIKQIAIAYSIIEISPQRVDQINIYEASKLGMVEAIQTLHHPVDVVLSDAMKFHLEGIIVEPIIHGDAKSITIAAASILAKVHRDALMKEYAGVYPQYDFEHNQGYGTKKHLAALEEFGITPIHRKTYAPVQAILMKQLSFNFS